MTIFDWPACQENAASRLMNMNFILYSTTGGAEVSPGKTLFQELTGLLAEDYNAYVNGLDHNPTTPLQKELISTLHKNLSLQPFLSSQKE